MDEQRQKRQIDVNYDAFMRMLTDLLPQHRDRFALMRDGAVIDFFDKPGEANRAGYRHYPDEIFSIQEVTDEPIDLGFWSHAAVRRDVTAARRFLSDDYRVGTGTAPE